MKNLFVIFSLIPFISFSQTEKSLLWRVTGPSSKHVSYLFGTMHTSDSLLNSFDRSWWKAFNSCDAFAGEVNMTDATEMMASLSVSMMKDSTLADFYTKEELARVTSAINKRLDPMTATMVFKMKPFFIMASLMEMPEEGSPLEIMDIHLQMTAADSGKMVVGLETMKEQAESVGVVSLREQAALLLDYIDNGDSMTAQVERMEKQYLMQDLEALAKTEAQFEVPDELMSSLLDDRNMRFLENLLPLLSQKSVFCAVGALHLAGKTGLITQLRDAGYTVVPVQFRFNQ